MIKIYAKMHQMESLYKIFSGKHAPDSPSKKSKSECCNVKRVCQFNN